MTAVQFDMFAPAPMVSRFPKDGPFASKVWRDEGDGTAIHSWFDGHGRCQSLCAPCVHCGIWHPLDIEPISHLTFAAAWRCPHGAGWAGTTGVAALRAGKRFVGIEQNPDHFRTAVARITAAWKQAEQRAA